MSERVLVAVNEGKIRGVKEVSIYSKCEYYAFYGIPYAEPPVKNLRFKDPVKVKPRKRVYDGTTEKEGCSQYSFLFGHLMGSEDCLFNNIYTSKLQNKNNSLRPVIVNIHGGAYHTGSPHTKHYGSPAFVIHHDIVYICVSYRLHILGFLNLGLEECSGNQGLKDIIMSLNWIKANVRSFGGDPDNITLLGASSGAGIINLLMLSPVVEKGLFHKAVLMSGYLLNPVAPYEKTNQHHGREICKLLSYKGDLDDNSQMLMFLKKKKPHELINSLLIYQMKTQTKTAPITGISVFSPSIDQYVLPCSPKKLLPSIMRIPIMVGFSEREAHIGFIKGLVLEHTNMNFLTTFCQNSWGWGSDLNDSEVKDINRQMELFYTNGNPVTNASLSDKVDIQSDICMSDFYETLVDPIAADLPESVFVYQFAFEGKIMTMKESDSLEERLSGTYHGSEYCHWNRFHWNLFDNPRDHRTRGMVNTFSKLVTTFAQTGEPNYDDLETRWKPYTLENPCFLRIDTPLKMAEGRLNEERSKFWNKIKAQFKKS